VTRGLRVEYEGACYHVVSRGNRKESISLGDKGKKRFLRKLYTGPRFSEIADFLNREPGWLSDIETRLDERDFPEATDGGQW